jgi:hypothetical protein
MSINNFLRENVTLKTLAHKAGNHFKSFAITAEDSGLLI